MSEAPLFAGTHDPSDVADYLVNFDDLLATAETVALQSVTIDAASTGVGMALGSGAYAPIAVSKSVRFWLTCSQPNNTTFATGVLTVVTVTVTTNASPARTFQRSVLVRVAQSEVLNAPMSLSEAKAHLRVIDDSENDYITGLIRAAADMIERDTGLVLRQRAASVTFDGWSTNDRTRLPLWRGPVVSVTSVAYDDEVGAEQVLAANQYRVRSFAGASWIVPANGVTWPAIELDIGTVRVTYQAGYATNDSVPASLRHAALLLIGHWYENREAVNSDRTPVDVPLSYEALVSAYRVLMVV
jgi:uncharacterized phiE125 gp8 family phage protein